MKNTVGNHSSRLEKEEDGIQSWRQSRYNGKNRWIYTENNKEIQKECARNLWLH
jgi:hypothetical protein